MISEKLLNYYDREKRDLPWRESPTPYRVWISEIMLQQTRATAVIPYFQRFLEHFPTVFDLAEAHEDLLHKLWEGLGYYSRAKNLKKAAEKIVSEYGGELPASYEKLLSLPGIGPYTAGAISSIAFQLPVPAIDGNLLRVYSRRFLIEETIDSAKGKKKIFALAEKEISTKRPGDFNQALMDLGNNVCLPKNPKCSICPLKEDCLALEKNCQEEFPKRKEKIKKTDEKWTVLLLEYDGEFFIEKRPSKGLLANLWQFPMIQGHLKLEDVEKFCQENFYIPKNIETLPSSSHVFSHKVWDLIGYKISLERVLVLEEEIPFGEKTWAKKKDLEEVYAFSSALTKYREEAIYGMDSKL
ncbi:A/G-specific adenine glycosylase [Peptoniphilus sp. KCTC 25270]|uniref:A/G-specific adenine glycosylase n=1 Tax=Peptoniphilus sp. KCTC 25270 TaxID=2897414 RepID=UPI001E4CDFB7|nr:A/G-specific adenine glycosylase [Peptoniphilus sp. KCTC 25270]MCD1147779.1 A/G-specific adenine glycosylase [Peptoniphilus sp. KCTC 25270]